MKVWVARRPGMEVLRQLPADIEVSAFPTDPVGHPALAEVEFLVPPFRNPDVLSALPAMRRLRVVQTLEAGVDWLIAAITPDITLCNARGVHESTVAEWTLGAILAAQRGLDTFARNQALHRWNPPLQDGQWVGPPVDELQDRTALIVGYGGIGAVGSAQPRTGRLDRFAQVRQDLRERAQVVDPGRGGHHRKPHPPSRAARPAT